jgi:hypothetical protein
MKGDFSRFRKYDPRMQFTQVLMQQGRVQLDADPNEQGAILLHYLRALAVDLIGPFGGPSDILSDGTLVQQKYGFQIEPDAPGGTITDLKIGVGRYYVDGILCENLDVDDEGNPVTDVSYYGQDQYPLNAETDQLPDQLPFLVYLDVWERHITYIEKESIREVALGGPDTATRAKVVWQVKVWCPGSESEWAQQLDDCNAENAGEWTDKWWPDLRRELQAENRGQLIAWTGDPDADSSASPCIMSSEAGYRGVENHLYRVEIHTGSRDRDGNSTTPTFKWSRDNGSVVAAWVGQESDDLIVSGVPGSTRGFAAGQWVELIDDDLELRGEPGTMVKLAQVEGGALTIDPETATGPVDWRPDLKHPKVRRWDHRETEASGQPRGAIPVEEGLPIRLENGVWIQFEGAAEEQPGNQYRTGDYWLIPARTATGDVEWPQREDDPGRLEPTAQPPHGVEHHYAPLAVVQAANGVLDLRRKFEPVWKHKIEDS